MSSCCSSAVADGQNKLILFGGRGLTGGTYVNNNPWVLTHANGLAGTATWTQVSPPSAIPPRANTPVNYDVKNNRLIVSCGYNGWGMSDTWVLANANGTGGTPSWIQLPSLPSAGRVNAAIAYDTVNNRLILHGGQTGGGQVCGSIFYDTWVPTSANGQGGTPVWTQVHDGSGARPPVPYNAWGVYDPASDRFIVVVSSVRA